MTDDILMHFGATATRDRDDLASVKQQTHDNVIAQLGDARTGPVSWRIIPAPRAVRFLNDNRRHLGPVDDLVRFLRRHPGGQLVIASAPYDHARLTPEQQAAAAADHASDREGHRHG